MKPAFCLKSNNIGFALMEIIFIFIIVGILSAIALPDLFNNAARSHAAEAIATMAAYKDSIEDCIKAQGGVSNCGSLTSMGLTSIAGNFTYGIITNPKMILIAYPVASSSATNYIQFNRQGLGVAHGKWQCQGFGAYIGICQ